jgi:hypothetical protein
MTKQQIINFMRRSQMSIPEAPMTRTKTDLIDITIAQARDCPDELRTKYMNMSSQDPGVTYDDLALAIKYHGGAVPVIDRHKGSVCTSKQACLGSLRQVLSQALENAREGVPTTKPQPRTQVIAPAPTYQAASPYEAVGAASAMPAVISQPPPAAPLPEEKPPKKIDKPEEQQVRILAVQPQQSDASFPLGIMADDYGNASTAEPAKAPVVVKSVLDTPSTIQITQFKPSSVRQGLKYPTGFGEGSYIIDVQCRQPAVDGQASYPIFVLGSLLFRIKDRPYSYLAIQDLSYDVRHEEIGPAYNRWLRRSTAFATLSDACKKTGLRYIMNLRSFWFCDATAITGEYKPGMQPTQRPFGFVECAVPQIAGQTIPYFVSLTHLLTIMSNRRIVPGLEGIGLIKLNSSGKIYDERKIFAQYFRSMYLEIFDVLMRQFGVVLGDELAADSVFFLIDRPRDANPGELDPNVDEIENERDFKNRVHPVLCPPFNSSLKNANDLSERDINAYRMAYMTRAASLLPKAVKYAEL